MPMNTIEYNLNKLLEVGLIKKSKNFFWSKKGKKIVMYRVSNKSVIISPKSSNISSKAKNLAVTLGLTGVGAFIVNQINKIPRTVREISYGTDEALMAAAPAATELTNTISTQIPIWIWFLIGAIFALTIFMILNWRRYR